MKILVFDCPMGIAGDMTVGALVDLGIRFDFLEREIGKLKLKGYWLSLRNVRSHAFRAKKFTVKVKDPYSHLHTSLREIERLIRRSKLHPQVKKTTVRIFRNLGRAEARVHGVPIQQIHFHEVGAVDSIIDIVGTAVCFHHLEINKAFVRHLTVGKGIQKGEHGPMPIPVPGAYELLKGFPLEQSSHRQEMVTPTGAAILATLCEKTVRIPRMKLKAVGYGAGDRKFNGERGLLRIAIGYT